ncbi:hypothetical protein ACMDCR_18065 [Labrys okinawensis]|uniref:hypothetical protein n=1 Tax=Labrys okinawensis TaxID=346911 RepID=UPI0039BD2E8F
MTTLDVCVAATGMLCSAGAAAFWLWASLINVPNNIDTFIGVLQRIGRLNAVAAAFGFVAALCAVYAFARSIGAVG